MKQVVIENPVINSSFEEPRMDFLFSKEGITNEIVEARCVSSCFVPIANFRDIPHISSPCKITVKS